MTEDLIEERHSHGHDCQQVVNRPHVRNMSYTHIRRQIPSNRDSKQSRISVVSRDLGYSSASSSRNRELIRKQACCGRRTLGHASRGTGSGIA